MRQAITFAILIWMAPVCHAQPVAVQDKILDRETLVHCGWLFYHDSRLSEDNTTSCATCHRISKGTTDLLKVAVGRVGGNENGQRLTAGVKGTKKSPSLLNIGQITAPAGLEAFMFWDGRRQGLFSQCSGPLENPDEMGSQQTADVANRMNQFVGYRNLMRKAYGTPDVTSFRLISAIVAFEVDALRATDCNLTRFYNGDSHMLSESAQRGAEHFRQRCFGCHPPPFYTNGMFANTGVQSLYGTNDQMLQRVTGNPAHARAVKVPSLLGVPERTPLSHIGVFPNIRSMLIHYNRGGASMANLRDIQVHGLVKQMGEKPLAPNQLDDLEAATVEGLVLLDYPQINPPRLADFPQ